MSFFSIFKKNDSIFDENGYLSLFSIFSDRVVFFLIKKERSKTGDTFSIINSIVETQEESFLKGDFDFDKLKLNCGKIKHKLANMNIKVGNIMFAFSPEVSASIFISKNFERVNREVKITQSEIDSMIIDIKSEFLKSGQMMSLEKLEKILIDGYPVQDYLELSGKNINIGILGVASKKEISLNLKSLASFLKGNFKGAFPLDISLVNLKKDFSKLEDALFINIFENLSSLFLLRSGRVDYIENADIGYGDFERHISEYFAVGREEAKSIKRKFISGDLDVSILDNIRSLSFISAENILSKIKPSLITLSKFDLLPANIFIYFSSDVTLQISQIFKKSNNWFSDLPFVKNVEVEFLNMSNMVNFFKDEKKLFTEGEYSYIYAIIYTISKLK
ncbi:MAG: hypothetical protein AAB614_02530 [Patescibacteria group bacterium]